MPIATRRPRGRSSSLPLSRISLPCSSGGSIRALPGGVSCHSRRDAWVPRQPCVDNPLMIYWNITELGNVDGVGMKRWSRIASYALVAGVVVGMGTLPAVHPGIPVASAGGSLYETSRLEAQQFTAPADAVSDPLDRGGYSATTSAEVSAIQEAQSRQWPLSGPFTVGEGLGARDGAHLGVDLAAAEGEPVHAAASGTVRLSQEAFDGYGVAVIIDHDQLHPTGERVSTLYAHLVHGSRTFEAGDRVEAGDILGAVGNTGRSYGAHLHFEVHLNGTPSDPLAWLPPVASP